MRVTADLLRQPIFRDMTAEQVGILLDLSDERIYRDRDPVIRITETNPDLFIVAEGGVEVRTATGDVLATMGQGSVFGEVSIVDEMPASATVLSQGMTRLNVIHRKTLHALLDGDPKMKAQLMENLARILAGRLRAMNAHIMVGRMDD
ncbi:MAG: Crp/Fnr family transcriptional regulator [Armatimonadota bacterium]|nr:cyclic nucleotide-binding domain-containing protein [Fimbriimonadaceae bacterium]